MGLQGLDWQVVQFPFAGGLDTKAHGQLLDPPGLSMCKNVEFDEAGALRLRKPYASIGVNIYGGGTLSNVRKFAVVGDELLCFTSAAVYSWSETLTAWVNKGEHLAVAVTESTRFGNTTDQVFADRAQLGGTVVMAWTEVVGSSVVAYLAAFDATTGVTTLAPTSFGSNSRPRVVALTAKIIVTWTDGTSLLATTIDPAAPAFTTAGATTLAADAPSTYDIEKQPGADAAVYVARNASGSGYTIGKVTSALAVSALSKAQVCDGVVAVACAPAAANLVRVLRGTAAFDVKSDLITLSTLSDVTMNTAIGSAASAILQLTGAHRSVTNGGQYRCYAFWSSRFSATAVTVETNWIDTNNATGTENDAFIGMSAVASRAFDYNGSVYFWSVFSESTAATIGGASVATALGIRGQFQNTYFLIRDDAYLVSQATKSRAGGSHYYSGHIPGVALVSGSTGYAWAGSERQVIVLGGTDTMGYSARAPRDIVFTFDSDDARRVVQIGRTAYVSGGLLLQYDGEGLTEVGFMQYPWRLQVVINVGGALDVGTYSYKSTLRWDNARGETERSTTAVGVQVTIAAGDKPQVTVYSDFATRKLTHPPSVEVWRQKANSNTGAPFYLTTSRDPATTGTDNCYLSLPALPNLTTAGSDNFTDATLETKEQSPENGDVLPRLAPPGASIAVASDVRMFLAGIPGDPYAVVYSLLRNEGEIVGFFDDLRFTIPSTTGPITGLALQSETLVVFTASAVYVIPGDGFDNTGGGSNYGPPRMISTDVGALSHDTLALTPTGLVFFSRKGWYRLSPGWDLEYIGAKVEDLNSDTWVAAQVVEAQHQVRFLSSSRMLVWDYLVNEWSEWTQASGRDLATWRGSAMLLDSAPKKEQSTFSTVDYPMVVVTGWLKPAQLQGMARLRRMMVLGEYKADHAQALEVGFDYATTYTDAVSMGFQSLTVGNPTQFRHGPSQQRIEAVRAKITIITAGRSGGGEIPASPTYPAADAVTLTGLAFEVGLRRGLYQRLPAAQKR